MSAPYTTLASNDSENLYTLFQFSNNTTGGTFIPFTILAIWFIAFIGSISEGRQASRAFIFASFVSAILSVIASLIGMLNPQYMYFSFLMVAGGLVWYKLDNAPGI